MGEIFLPIEWLLYSVFLETFGVLMIYINWHSILRHRYQIKTHWMRMDLVRKEGREIEKPWIRTKNASTGK